jgi:hypothetical protein
VFDSERKIAVAPQGATSIATESAQWRARRSPLAYRKRLEAGLIAIRRSARLNKEG